ncbi:hypothetical protein [Saccharothrix deserti]|uniref:hypothetical protein n=1 Tax=Saccharothrix deserti TaxID=2593674 RepID=UPI00131B94A3|nr:hypothetical protein [Saccharothrix deserti]
MDQPITKRDGAALRRVVDLALRGIRAKARTPHPARPATDTRWVMSSDGVIDGAHDPDHPDTAPER